MRAMIENVNYINLFNSIVYGWTLHTHRVTQNKWGKETDVQKKKKKKKNKWEKKGYEHTKERAEKWMRSNRKRQKIKEEIDKSRKKRKVLLVEIFIQNTWDFFFPFFSPIFSLIWGDCILVGTRRKYSCPTSFPSHFLLQIKTPKYHSLLPFPSLQNHPN